jgi:hypothetical protein
MLVKVKGEMGMRLTIALFLLLCVSSGLDANATNQIMSRLQTYRAQELRIRSQSRTMELSQRIGQRLLEQRRYEEAKPYLDTAMKLGRIIPPGLDDYTHGDIAALLARWHQEQRHWKEAEAARIEEIQFGNPHYQRGRLELFEIYFTQGKLDEAEATLNEADKVMYNLRHELREKQAKLYIAKKYYGKLILVQTRNVLDNLLRELSYHDCLFS